MAVCESNKSTHAVLFLLTTTQYYSGIVTLKTTRSNNKVKRYYCTYFHIFYIELIVEILNSSVVYSESNVL